MIQRKWFAIVLLVLLVTLTGVATLQAREVTLKFLTWGDTSIWQPLITAFENEHPDIKIDTMWNPPDYGTKLTSMFAGGVAPDLFWLTYESIPQWANQGLLYDLSRYAAADAEFQSYKKDYIPVLLNGFTWGGALYGLPNAFNPYVLYYNVDMFDKAGVAYPDVALTWDQLLATAKKFTNPEKKTFGLVGSYHWFSYMWQNGGDILDNNGKVIFDSESNIQALQFVQDLQFKYQVATQTQQVFVDGDAAMMMAGGWFVGIPTWQPSFKWRVGAMPKNKQEATQLAFDGTVVAATTKYPKEAWEFVKFLSGPKGQERLAKQTKLTVPVLMSTARASLEKTDSRYESLVHRIDQVNSGRIMPGVVRYDDMMNVFGEEMAQFWDTQLSVDAMVQNIANRLRAIFK